MTEQVTASRPRPSGHRAAAGAPATTWRRCCGRRSRSSTSAATTGRAWRTCRGASASPNPGSTTTCRARKSCSGWRSTGRSTGCGRPASGRGRSTRPPSSGWRRWSATRLPVLVERLPYVTLLLRVRGNTDVERAALARRRAFDALVASLVEEAERDGDIRADIDPKLAARLLFGTVNSIVEWYRPTSTCRRPRSRTGCASSRSTACGCAGNPARGGGRAVRGCARGIQR